MNKEFQKAEMFSLISRNGPDVHVKRSAPARPIVGHHKGCCQPTCLIRRGRMDNVGQFWPRLKRTTQASDFFRKFFPKTKSTQSLFAGAVRS